MQDARLIPGTEALAASPATRIEAPSSQREAPRLRRPDRAQAVFEPVCLDEKLPADHTARTVWQVVEQLDLSAFYDGIAARGSDPGRSATDPKLLLAATVVAVIIQSIWLDSELCSGYIRVVQRRA